MDVITNYLDYFHIYCKSFFNCYQIWFLSILSSGLVGLTGILPMLIIPLNDSNYITSQSKRLRLLLSFAVGSLLGDVFLHLIPEACRLSLNSGISPHSTYYSLGIWVLSGIFTFVIIQIIVSSHVNINQKLYAHKTSNNGTSSSSDHQISNFYNKENNNFSKNKLHYCSMNENKIRVAESKPIDTIGYLNLLANGIDNFTHGLAVAASFISGTKIGFLTTFAIIIHEIPHEVGDFAILMRSGFSKCDAMKAQILTASIGIFGSIFALSFDYINKAKIQIWILPFTCGGFINIALVSILPELLAENDPWESIKQTIALGCGIGVMALVNCLE